MASSIRDEIRNALWGCVEIPLYLRKGATRFQGNIAAFAMMLLTSFYCYSYLAYMIMHILRVNGFIAVTIAILDLMLSDVVRNLTGYFMLHYM